MIQLTSIQELQTYLNSQSGSLGFVPTMGALHPGHGELIKKSSQENQRTLVSIFVNPTQFNDPQDLAKYPRTLEADCRLAEQFGAHAVWIPHESELYPDQYRYRISENHLSRILCGEHRPGHFDGVLTIVLKLLSLTSPDRAYFGEKDYQQFLLVQDLAKAFFLKSQIIPVATVRETDGLAMSSRNTRLNAEQRKIAPLLYKIITTAQSCEEAQKQLQQNGFRVDYVTEYNKRRFAAAFLGDVRLIDNVKI